jgi:excisionase family DNA binding protein
MTVKEFAEKAEISLSLAYALVAEGRVPHRRIGQRGRRGAIRISEEDFRQFMEAVKAGSTAAWA